MDCDGLLVALQSDKIDMAFAAMNPTEERKQNPCTKRISSRKSCI